MNGPLARVARVAVTEWGIALRSRRALVVTLLFLAVSCLMMFCTISIFAALEREVVAALRLPPSATTGSVTMALWKSPVFVRVMDHFAGNSLLFADIRGRHPILLAYAMFLFQVVPLLTLLVSASRVADDIRSGTVRYWLARVTRNEWSVGKYLGEAAMLSAAMFAGALAAWGVAVWRFAGWDGAVLLPGILDWTLRACVYAFAWLGLFTGLSHLARSGGKATALSILAMLGAAAWPLMLENLTPETGVLAGLRHLDVLVPRTSMPLLWRRAPGALVQGVVQLVALGFLYLSFGAAVFRRRDV